jgi:Cupin domain
MPKASRETASERVELEGYEGRFEHWDGGYSVGFEKYTADAELAPLFVGLPDDHCQCPHWGYVIQGKVMFTYVDGHSETYETGDAYYAPPGHLPTLFAGSEIVEFHPTAELEKTMEVVTKNMAAAAG